MLTLTNILERGSWIITNWGMPLVFFYHLIISNVFINTAAEDAAGLEKLANTVLIPTQYFFEGKKALPIVDEEGKIAYYLERRFDYQYHFFFKTAAAISALPLSLVLGSSLKALAYFSSETRERANLIHTAIVTPKIKSNVEYYRSIGMKVEDFETAQWIDPPQYKKAENHRLEPDVQALKEIVHILHKYKIPFWVDCGTCLGAYRYGGTIPWDWDIDIGILKTDFRNVKQALQELDSKKYVVQDWSGRARPESYLKVLVRESGGMIDLYNFGFDVEKKMVFTILSNEHNIFLPTSWKKRELRYTTPMPFDYVFPLKKAYIEGIEVPVPGNVVKYLQTFYGENLAPARIYNEITQQYEKDFTHPYWKMEYAH